MKYVNEAMRGLIRERKVGMLKEKLQSHDH
jgi:hypothetical protein